MIDKEAMKKRLTQSKEKGRKNLQLTKVILLNYKIVLRQKYKLTRCIG